MHNLETNIIINASPEKVWQVLINFDKYPEWNPFIHIHGQAKEGSTLKNTIFLDNQKPQVFQPKVLAVQTQKELRWLGHLFFKGLFDGEHYFKLQATDDGKTQFIQGENFSGLLVKFILKLIGESTKTGFIKMNEALKKRVEC